MTYDPTFPKANESPASQVNQIRQNFASVASVFSSTVLGVRYNHTPFNDINEGCHEAIIFQNRLGDLDVTEDLGMLYAKSVASASSTEPQLFYRNKKFLPITSNIPTQLFFNTINTVGPNYQSFIANGYLVFFGTTNNIAANIVLTPTPTQIVMAIAQANTASGFTGFDCSVAVTQPNTIKINSGNAFGAYLFSWFVIAKA